MCVSTRAARDCGVGEALAGRGGEGVPRGAVGQGRLHSAHAHATVQTRRGQLQVINTTTTNTFFIKCTTKWPIFKT